MAAFEGVVDGKLMHARWLHIMVEGAEDILDGAYEDMARALLQAPPWHSGALATGELGWRLTGYARSVRAAAMYRARLWRGEDLAAAYFRWAHGSMGKTWAKRSKAVLEEWGVPDLPETVWGGWGETTVKQYKKLVDERLWAASGEKWAAKARRRIYPVPYMAYAPGISGVVRMLLRERVSWEVHKKVWGWCRLRAQLAHFTEMEGRASRARAATCIFCGRTAPAPYHHVLGECLKWREEREGVARRRMGPRPVLCIHDILMPEWSQLCDAIEVGARMEEAARAHWRRRGVTRW